MEIQSHYKKMEAGEGVSLREYEEYIGRKKCENLADVIFSPDLIRDYPSITEYFAKEEPSISTLHFISGVHLFMLLGTNSGAIFIIPLSTRLDEPFVLVKDTHRSGAAVRYLRVFHGNLFVSWEDGWLSIYNIQNIASHLEIHKINRGLEENNKKHEVWCTDLHKLLVLE